MKKLLVLLSVLVIGLSACKKEEKAEQFDAAAQAAADDAKIQAYIKANNLEGVIKDPSGLYYKVMTPGTGAYPTSNSTVTVNYTGKFLDNAVFETGTGLNGKLNGGLIAGWDIGIPHVNSGGRILLIIPSALAYGHSGQGKIAPDTVLIFLVDLLSFTN